MCIIYSLMCWPHYISAYLMLLALTFWEYSQALGRLEASMSSIDY